MKKKTFTTVLGVLLLFVFVSVIPSYGARVTETKKTKALVSVPDTMVFVPIALNFEITYQGTYSYSGKSKVYTSHSHTLKTSSLNDPTYLNELSISQGMLRFVSPNVTCKTIKCSHSYKKVKPVFDIKHSCSNTKITCTLGGDTTAESGVIVVGGVFPVSKTVVFSGIAK